MLPTELEEALSTLAAAAAARPELLDALAGRWGQHRPAGDDLPPELAAATDTVQRVLPAVTQTDAGVAGLAAPCAGAAGPVLLAWCSASAWRADARVAPVLALAAARPALAAAVPGAASARVVAGPLRDALACAPLLGDGAALREPGNAEARARLEILVWEAGAAALEVPALGRWLFGSAATFGEMVDAPAHGTLRGRVLAARCLEVSSGGMPPGTDEETIGDTLRVLQPLLLHPEPLVWIHAARALGRLTGPLDRLEGMLLDWVHGDRPILRQRAITAFASLPAERLRFLAGQLAALVAAPDADGWVLAAVGAATPYLRYERPDLWAKLAARVLAGDGGAVAARALARGCASVWRRGVRDGDVVATMTALRELARHVGLAAFDDLRRWIEVIATTDVVDGAERDPLDLEIGLDNLMRIAAQYDDEEADARAARFAGTLAATFQEARRIAVGGGRPRLRAAAINALEASARAFALRLWRPLLTTRPSGEPIEEPDLTETWKLVAEAPAELLDLVRDRRHREGAADAADLPLEVLAVQLGGYALDACGSNLGPGGGPTAHATCLWLRKIDGLADGSRDLPGPLRTALAKLFWRLVDTTRGTTLGEVDDVTWLGPFAAWWALVIDRPGMLAPLATALPMMAAGALDRCTAAAESLRTAVAAGGPDGEWGAGAASALAELHAEDTELAHALANLARALQGFAAASGLSPDLDALCLDLVFAGDRLQQALADPVKGLHGAGAGGEETSLERRASENAPRVATLVARAIRARELSMIDVWLASLGPVVSALLEGAARGAIRRSPPPPPPARQRAPTLIAGHELVRPLGEGGVGTVWLVRKPGANRLFVLKIPKAEALQNANDTERQGILASFVEEAAALAGLYHPNVANIIDRGVEQGVPFLVLELLIGADLKQYSAARRMTLFELRQVVLDACAGLAALHHAGLVHRDIKPGNLYVRLPLAGGESFDPQKHRDPATTPPLSTVVIDFGMVRAARVPPDAAGRFVAGTAGYIAPEQVLDPVELDGRADVYALAGTIYNVTTGRAFFDEIENQRDRIVAHMRHDPFEDPERLRGYPTTIATLMRAATAMKWADRPTPLEFARAFAAGL